jgi:predicted MPP superfamily phosphohydrolase
LLLIAVSLALILVGIIGYREATAPPLVRRLTVTASNYPQAAEPVRIVLFSDLHAHGPDMPPRRIARIVEQINALHPDIIVAAGDFIGDNWVGKHFSISQAIEPLGGLRARLGVYAVLGNNDYDVGGAEVARALERAGIHVMMNDATSVGPLALGGIDGRLYQSRPEWQAADERAYRAIERTRGVKVLVAHRPDEFVPAPEYIDAMLAGHTHCGQIVLPVIGALETGSDYGRKYACGVYRSGSKLLVVTAGLGTSHVPLRIGAPPDIWLISIRGPSAGGKRN